MVVSMMQLVIELPGVDSIKEKRRIVSSLKEMNVEASIIGEVTPSKEGRWVICGDGRKEELLPQDQDHVYKVLSKYGLGKAP